jgi:hypothetical protein
MAKISHTKLKQPSFGEKRQKFPDLRGNNEKHGY